MQTMRAMAAEVRGQALDGVTAREHELLIMWLTRIKANLLALTSNGAADDSPTEDREEFADG
jgi:hypothetical protein